jgi:hypothetical protein
MTHATLFNSALPQQLSGPRRRLGTLLSFGLLAALFGGAVSLLLASGILSEASGSARRLMPERAGMLAPGPAAPLHLPGFQRRGNMLTGQVTAEDGRHLRLVIDARTNAIIGAKLVEPPAPPAH